MWYTGCSYVNCNIHNDGMICILYDTYIISSYIWIVNVSDSQVHYDHTLKLHIVFANSEYDTAVNHFGSKYILYILYTV